MECITHFAPKIPEYYELHIIIFHQLFFGGNRGYTLRNKSLNECKKRILSLLFSS